MIDPKDNYHNRLVTYLPDWLPFPNMYKQVAIISMNIWGGTPVSKISIL